MIIRLNKPIFEELINNFTDMRLTYTLLCLGMLLHTSCSNDNSNTGDSAKTKSVKITVPEDICSLINMEMIQHYFDVVETDLEMVLDLENYEEYATCGYKWEKSNFEELKELRLEKMMAMSFQKEGEGKASVSDILELESPYSLVYVGKFKTYKDAKNAKDRFVQSHKVPTKEDMEHLKKEINKSEELTEDQKEMGNDFSGEIGSNLEFKKIVGVGDIAFYDYLNKSVDVLLSDISFSVLIDSEKPLEENIDIAKNIAVEVIQVIAK